MVGRKTWPMPRRAKSMVRSRPTAPGRPRPPWHECGVGPRRHEGCFREAQRHCSREAQRPGAGDSVPCGRRAVTRGSMPSGPASPAGRTRRMRWGRGLVRKPGLPCGSRTTGSSVVDAKDDVQICHKGRCGARAASMKPHDSAVLSSAFERCEPLCGRFGHGARSRRLKRDRPLRGRRQMSRMTVRSRSLKRD